MLSNRAYLMRAFYDWIVDSQCTPYVMIDADLRGVRVPEEFVQEGKIVLNLSPASIADLHITNKALSFRASFSGIEHQVDAPMPAIMAIYAMENGRGMVFEGEEYEQEVLALEMGEWHPDGEEEEEGGEAGSKGRGKGHLHIVE